MVASSISDAASIVKTYLEVTIHSSQASDHPYGAVRSNSYSLVYIIYVYVCSCASYTLLVAIIYRVEGLGKGLLHMENGKNFFGRILVTVCKEINAHELDFFVCCKCVKL